MQRLRAFLVPYEIYWMFRSHAEQRLSWKDAQQARLARDRAEALARAQLQAMLAANPSGSLGHSSLNNLDLLKDSGLI